MPPRKIQRAIIGKQYLLCQGLPELDCLIISGHEVWNAVYCFVLSGVSYQPFFHNINIQYPLFHNLFVWLRIYQSTHKKTNMEPQNGGLEDVFPFPRVIFSFNMLNFGGESSSSYLSLLSGCWEVVTRLWWHHLPWNPRSNSSIRQNEQQGPGLRRLKMQLGQNKTPDIGMVWTYLLAQMLNRCIYLHLPPKLPKWSQI